VGSAVILYIGIFTSLLAGLAAFLECDLKKIIAYSTLSHLGIIVSALGLGESALCFAHLNTHAAFKALLFLAVGTVIHSTFGSQEARCLTSLLSTSPLLFSVITVTTASICGFIFLSGWVTKDAILVRLYNRHTGIFVLLSFYLRISLTLLYSLRLLMTVSGPGVSSVPLGSALSMPSILVFPCLVLLVHSIVSGVVLTPLSRLHRVHLDVFSLLTVWGVVCLRLVHSRLTIGVKYHVFSPNSALVGGTLALRWFTVPFSSLAATEVGSIQGFGLSEVPGLVGLVCFRGNILSKGLLYLCLCFLLC